jgi:hypothetical protein
MGKKHLDVQWVVQRNLTSSEDLNGLRSGCVNLNIRCLEIDIIPFTTSLPYFEKTPCSIYYGSTTFNNLIYENPETRSGLFFNPETFSIENYINNWGRHMLNYGASVTTFKELMNNTYDNEKLLFLRPNDDSKSFAGEIKKFLEIGQWYESLKHISNINLSLESKIIVSEPYNIKSEWRLWIVNKKVVAASKYRQQFKLTKEPGCPHDVMLFAEMRCKEYTPHDVFVMDICLCGDEYYIIECGCMNGAGFYKADISKIVEAVSIYFSGVCEQ